MSTDLTTTHDRKLSEVMAAAVHLPPAQYVQALRATVVPPNTSDAQLAAFLVVAHKYGLNPLVKEIYAFPNKGGGIVPIVSVDGWCRIVNDHPAFDGAKFIDQRDDKGNVVAVTCEMFRKDRAHPVVVTEYLSECRGNTQVWQRWPSRMLRHRAFMQASRYAFGFGGLMDEDDYKRSTMAHGGDVTVRPTDPPETVDAILGDAEPIQPEPAAVVADGEFLDTTQIDDAAAAELFFASKGKK